MINSKKTVPTTSTKPAATASVANGSTAPGAPKHNGTSDPKPDSSAIQAKKVKSETVAPKPALTTSSSAATAKQPQQHSLSKPHTQQQQQQPQQQQQQQQQPQQQQQRYFVPSRQNQEEAVFKMVQNIFKLLENRGPLTMAQLEYNLPILILGPKSNAQTINGTSSKTSSPTGDSGNSASKKQNNDAKTSKSKTSLCEKKLIPGNMVPDIVELLVTLGLIQQQTNGDDPTQQQAESTKSQPRFAVHFGKPKQFLVTPTNVLSEIAKAQTEIQLSRQRQEMLKEALGMGDEQAAERVKHIVLQHPQVVDDPVYVTALRNLQVDGMLMASATGNANAGSSNASSSSTSKDGSGKSKSGVVGGAKNVGGGKRRRSGSGGSGSGSGGIPTKSKRQRTKKETPARSGDTNSGLGTKATISSGTTGTRGGPLPTGVSSARASTSAAATSTPSLPTPTVPPAGALTSATNTKSTT